VCSRIEQLKSSIFMVNPQIIQLLLGQYNNQTAINYLNLYSWTSLSIDVGKMQFCGIRYQSKSNLTQILLLFTWVQALRSTQIIIFSQLSLKWDNEYYSNISISEYPNIIRLWHYWYLMAVFTLLVANHIFRRKLFVKHSRNSMFR